MAVVEYAEAPHLILTGEIDVAVAAELRATGSRVVDGLGPGADLEIDMEGVTFIDSSGFGALVSIRNAAEASGHPVLLRLSSPPLVRLFELMGLRDSFTLVTASR